MTKDVQKQIWELLCCCDKEFVPPLSDRYNITQKEFSNKEKSEKPHKYFSDMIKLDFVIAKVNEKIIGFIAFYKTYSCEVLSQYKTFLYIATICVNPAFRGKGVLTNMYDYLEKKITKKFNQNQIVTRTWSSNVHHIKMLEKREYTKILVLINNRGNNIDTIYFRKVL
ncbi:MAG: GNAT family N-acetyltransferase [Eubacteriales bacterium]